MADTRNADWPPKAGDEGEPSPAGGEARVDPRVGQVLLERYRIGRKLGQGGMGTVFEGTHLLIERRVAIKCLHPQYNDDEDVLRRFHNEARAVSAIGHPHIVEALDRGRMEDGTAFIVFEYLDGQDLGSFIEDGVPLPEDQVLHIVRQVCQALAAAHDKGIVHRDLKPENIFLLERGGDSQFVKLLDFGISKLDASSKITSKGSVMGTPHYMSPEQASGFELDGRTDLYAPGVVLYVMLSGQLPFGADSMPALMMKIVAERPAELVRVNPSVSAGLSAVVDRLLAKRPEDRYTSAHEALEALEAAVAAPDSAEPVAVPVAPSRPWLALALAAGAALAGAGWLLWPGEESGRSAPEVSIEEAPRVSVHLPVDAATDHGRPDSGPGDQGIEQSVPSPRSARRASRQAGRVRSEAGEVQPASNTETPEPEPPAPEPVPPEPAEVPEAAPSPPAGLKNIAI